MIKECNLITNCFQIKRNSLFGSRHLTYEIPLPMDEYNDPDIVRVGENFYTKSGVDSPKPYSSQRAMSLCIDPNQQITKATVVRNISSPPSMPGTSQKRFSLRSSFTRLTGGGSRSESMRSNKQSRCDDTIMEGNEMAPRTISEPNGGTCEDGKSSERSQIDGESEDLMRKKKKSSGTKSEENQLDYWIFYFKKCGLTLILIFSISSCFYQSLKIYSDLWLNEVVDDKEDLKEVRGRSLGFLDLLIDPHSFSLSSCVPNSTLTSY